jgi:catechol 2,3-dioxygenase-like lactoylglutathione lyase family enzyme
MAVIPYHAGVLVSDMRSAMDRLTADLGYSFTTPVLMTPQHVEDRVSGDMGPMELLVAYTREGPFRVELIEFTGNGLYAKEQGEGLHHLGVWEPDIDARLAALESAGTSIDAIFRSPSGRLSVIYAGRGAGAGGVRVEYVSESLRARLEEWFRTDVLAPPEL